MRPKHDNRDAWVAYARVPAVREESSIETDVQANPPADPLHPIAAWWHTALVLAVTAATALRGALRAAHLRVMAHPDRINMYERTILFEWLVLGLVLAGVWWHGSSVLTVLGDRWRSVRQFLEDVGIGLLFLIASIALTSIAGAHGAAHDRTTQFLLPQGRSELALWIVLSITAGICEEAVYRGYLAETTHGADQKRPPRHRSFGIGVRRGPLLSGLVESIDDRSDGSNGRHSGLLAPQRASWDDRPRTTRCARRLGQTLGWLPTEVALAFDGACGPRSHHTTTHRGDEDHNWGDFRPCWATLKSLLV